MESSFVISFDPSLPINRLFINERFVRIINDLNIVERYFDNRLVKEMFEYYDRNVYRPLANAALTAAKLNLPVYMAVTGVFLEMAYKYDQELFKKIYAASSTGKVKIIPSTFYGGLYPLCESSGEEIGEQVKLVSELTAKYGLQRAPVAVMPYLIYNEWVEKGAKAAGAEYVITEEVDGFTSHRYLYTNSSNDLRIVIRNREASLALADGQFDRLGKDVEGLIYVSAEEVAQKGEAFAEVLGNYIYRGGLDLKEVPPSKLPASGTLYAPGRPYLYDLSYGSPTPLWEREKAQTMLLSKACSLLSYVRWLGDQRMLQIWRILLQADLFLAMTGEPSRRAKVMADKEEAKLSYAYILGDFEGKLASMILKKKEKAAVQEARPKL
ncbi:MAG: hypothetical protein ACP5GH_03395 [Nitrososphaeria archaeon]